MPAVCRLSFSGILKQMPKIAKCQILHIDLLPLRARLLESNLKATKYFKSTERVKNPNWRSQRVEPGITWNNSDKRGTFPRDHWTPTSATLPFNFVM